jgi:hypothetical protein
MLLSPCRYVRRARNSNDEISSRSIYARQTNLARFNLAFKTLFELEPLLVLLL